MNHNNLAQKTNWLAGSDKFETVPFYLTSVNIPGVNLTHPEVGGRASTVMQIPADNVAFNSLTFEMLIDEDFEIYKELMGIVMKEVDVQSGTFADFNFNFWVELTNSKGHKVMKLEFSNCRIAGIGDINLDSQDETTEYSLQIEITYDFFEIENNPILTLDTSPNPE